MLHLLYAARREGIATEYNARFAQRGLREFIGALPEGHETLMGSVRASGMSLYGAALASSGKERFLDKTPRYYLIIPELMETFPEATFLFLVRNPVDVFSSILEHHARGDWTRLGRRDLLHDLLTAPAAIHRAAAPGGKGYLIRYEDLVGDPRRTLESICEAIGVGFDEATLRYERLEDETSRLGDSVAIDRHDSPVRDYLSAWQGRLDSGRKRGLALSYLRDLDPVILADLGYDHAELQRQLLSNLGDGSLKASARAWRTLATSPSRRTWREHLWLASAGSLHERGAVRTIGRALYIAGRGRAPHQPKDSGVTT